MSTPDAVHQAAVATLVAQLTSAHATLTELLGVEPRGVRAVEIADGHVAYLAAVGDEGVACLIDGALAKRRRDVEQVATASLVWEHLEQALDPEALGYLLGAAGRAIAQLGSHVTTVDAVAATAQAVERLLEWRADPLRARASLPDVDHGAALQEAAWRAYGVFVRESEPLAHRQADLTPELVSALRVWEEAAGRAGITARLTDEMGQVVRACAEAAPEIVERHVTQLTGP